MSALDPAEDQMIHNGIRALENIGAHLTGQGQRDAPIEFGTLRSVGRWDVVEDTGRRRYVVEVTFSLPYAAVQHEREDYEHPRGGKAHYLSDPLKANAVRYEDIMRKAILYPRRLP